MSGPPLRVLLRPLPLRGRPGGLGTAPLGAPSRPVSSGAAGHAGQLPRLPGAGGREGAGPRAGGRRRRRGRQVQRGGRRAERGCPGLLLCSPARLRRPEPRGFPVRTLVRASWTAPNCHRAPRHCASGASGHASPGSHRRAPGQPRAAGSGAGSARRRRRGGPRRAEHVAAWEAAPGNGCLSGCGGDLEPVSPRRPLALAPEPGLAAERSRAAAAGSVTGLPGRAGGGSWELVHVNSPQNPIFLAARCTGACVCVGVLSFPPQTEANWTPAGLALLASL